MAQAGADGAGADDLPDFSGDDQRVSPVQRRLLWSLAALSAVVATLLTVRAATEDHRARGPEEGDVIPSVAPAASASGSGASPAGASRSAGRTPSPSLSKSVSVPFLPIELEAEAASAERAGAAEVVPYAGASGGRIVRNIGRSGPGAKKIGSITFIGVTVPESGAYAMTLYVVHDDGGSSHTAVISVAGGGSVTVTTAAGTACCAHTTIMITLKKGRNAVTIDNPDGRAASVDRIVISAG
jgi:hypothetical protein